MSGKSRWQDDEIKAFITNLNDEYASGTDRGLVLVCAATSDEILRRLILERLVYNKISQKLLGSEGESAISTFSARIDTAFALGLLLQVEHAGLTLIRRIRNDSAHAVTFSLDDSVQSQRVIALCNLYPEISFMRSGSNFRKMFADYSLMLIANMNSRPFVIHSMRLHELKLKNS